MKHVHVIDHINTLCSLNGQFLVQTHWSSQLSAFLFAATRGNRCGNCEHWSSWDIWRLFTPSFGQFTTPALHQCLQARCHFCCPSVKTVKVSFWCRISVASRCCLRSSTSSELVIPLSQLVTVGDRSFAVTGPRLWNTAWMHYICAVLYWCFDKNWRCICFSNLIQILYCSLFGLLRPVVLKSFY